ncbi:unnamed protein product [Larinioides sclopetarius]|uniref:Uncharacterized protein n=1 Tax=Larinioides sclopetarius TaxID=280406 RepID=A0AAV1YV97_9ARAC
MTQYFSLTKTIQFSSVSLSYYTQTAEEPSDCNLLIHTINP